MLKKIMSTLLAVLFLSIFLNNSDAVENSAGKDIFVNAKCNICHSVTSHGIDAKKKSNTTPDLSNVGASFKTAGLKTYLKKESELNGKKHPRTFDGNEADFETLVTWLLTLKTAAN
jgi:hypothetical protein